MRTRLFADPVGDEVALRRQARALLSTGGGHLLTRRRLQDISNEKGVNLAACLLHESLLASDRHGGFIRRIDAAAIEPAASTAPPSLVIVPGMFYREHPEIGADGGLLREVAAQFGIRSRVVPTASLGSVAGNIDILHECLSALPEQPFWLASMSRGSAEVKLLLRKHAGAPYLKHLTAWINICGIVAGSPLLESVYANRVVASLHNAFARFNGVGAGLARELLASNEHWQPTCHPPGTHIVHVVAIPLSWHITRDAIRRYRRICHLGPTDGVVLLESYLDEPGVIYPLWGVDHFLRTARIPALFYRLLNHLLSQGRGRNDQTDLDPEFAGSLRASRHRAGQQLG